MIAQFMFTSAESKFLIAKSLINIERVQKAANEGILAFHPSSSTYCVVKELTGNKPPGKVWVTGMVVPKGLCVEASTQVTRTDSDAGEGLGKALADPGLYPHTIVIHRGEVVTGWTIYDLMERMKPGDIYVKGVNALDSSNKVGVLLGSLAEGTIGKILAASKEKGFEIVCPVGLEKFIPGDLDECSELIKGTKEYSMGQKCRLRVFGATVVTEIDALKILADVEAVPFAAGGLDGAEGSICIAVSGSEEKVRRAIEIAESVKGQLLPQVKAPICLDCSHPSCHLAGKKMHWVNE